MTEPIEERTPEDMVTLLARQGVTVTEDGRARARRRLDEAAQRRDPALRAALRERLGLRPTSAA
jgi:hypothetical protein